MTTYEALEFVSRFAPCPHDAVDTTLGDGTTWVKCEYCGDVMLAENIQYHRDTAAMFDEAINLLSDALGGPVMKMVWERDAEIEKLIEAEKLLLTITTDLLEKIGIDGLLPEYDEACKMLKEAKSLMNEQYGNEKTK